MALLGKKETAEEKKVSVEEFQVRYGLRTWPADLMIVQRVATTAGTMV